MKQNKNEKELSLLNETTNDQNQNKPQDVLDKEPETKLEMAKRYLSDIRVIIGILLVCLIIYLIFRKTKSNTDWMSFISDTNLISVLSIPGTFNSAGFNTNKPELQSQYPTYTFVKQLENGIRFFDIRLKVNKDDKSKLGFFYKEDLNLDFSVFLNDISAYFKKHPTEGVLIRVKNEGNSNSTDFSEAFDGYLTNTDYMNLFMFRKEIPTLKDLRGKIWIFSDFKWETTPEYNEWKRTINQEGGPVSAEEKQKKIREQFTKSSKDTDQNNIFVNFLNIETPNKSVVEVSKLTEKIPTEFKGRLGIIPMTYPVQATIDHILTQNYNIIFQVFPY